MVAPRVEVHELARDLRERVFGLRGRGDDGRVGVEVQLLPVLEETGRVSPVEAADGPSTLGLLRALARDRSWTETVSEVGSPRVDLPGGGAVRLLPGGQVEVSTPPASSVRETPETLEGVVPRVVEEGREAGIRMVARGIDPENPLDRAPLQLRTQRCRRLARHFDRYGSAGRRTMRRTAAIHSSWRGSSTTTRPWRGSTPS